MRKSRLEAFSDGVLAIIITIMVLELRVPDGHDWTDLLVLWPKFLSYLISSFTLASTGTTTITCFSSSSG